MVAMPNRRLTEVELLHANALLALVRDRIDWLSGDDLELRFAYNRKIAKELTYDERGKPIWRRKLKVLKRKTQDGKCAQCCEPLRERNAVLDRFRASEGYTEENTQLICESCDRRIQSERGYR